MMNLIVERFSQNQKLNIREQFITINVSAHPCQHHFFKHVGGDWQVEIFFKNPVFV